jgi:transcriptional regulator with XRE-family HTH domain
VLDPTGKKPIQSDLYAAYAKRVGENIVCLRKAKNWTQDDLVEAVQRYNGGGYLYRQNLSKAERGKRFLHFYVLEAIADAFGISVISLIKSTDTEALIQEMKDAAQQKSPKPHR